MLKSQVQHFNDFIYKVCSKEFIQPEFNEGQILKFEFFIIKRQNNKLARINKGMILSNISQRQFLISFLFSYQHIFNYMYI